MQPPLDYRPARRRIRASSPRAAIALRQRGPFATEDAFCERAILATLAACKHGALEGCGSSEGTLVPGVRRRPNVPQPRQFWTMSVGAFRRRNSRNPNCRPVSGYVRARSGRDGGLHVGGNQARRLLVCVGSSATTGVRAHFRRAAPPLEQSLSASRTLLVLRSCSTPDPGERETAQTTSTDTKSGVSCSAAVRQPRPSACKGSAPTRAANDQPRIPARPLSPRGRSLERRHRWLREFCNGTRPALIRGGSETAGCTRQSGRETSATSASSGVVSRRPPNCKQKSSSPGAVDQTAAPGAKQARFGAQPPCLRGPPGAGPQQTR